MSTVVTATLRSAGFSLGAGRGRVLFQLRNGPLTHGQLAELNHTTGPYVSLIVDKLEEHGLVQRGPHPDDRRRKLVSLTRSGLDAIATAEAILYRPPAAITILTDEELNQLTGLVQRGHRRRRIAGMSERRECRDRFADTEHSPLLCSIRPQAPQNRVGDDQANGTAKSQ